MHAGHVVEVGDVHQVFDAPRDDYTRGLIASIPRMELPESTNLSGGAR
jgi:ABC-type dipeptide/oligopeptide/nickel transport system ATPase component